MTDQTATGTNIIDIEIRPDAACFLDVAVTKPTGAVLTIIKKYGASGAEVPQIVSADATTATAVEVTEIAMNAGDELRVDIDGTSGNKVVSAQAWRIA
jgi:hypothetical protein